MERFLRNSMLGALVVFVLLSAGCQRKVEVETGTKVLCSYGHVISDDVRMIKVPQKEAIDHYVRTEVRTCDKHAQAERLYQEAQRAIASGDLKAAQEKLAQVVGLDGSFADAAGQLAEVERNKTPAADSGGGAPQGGTSTGGKPGDGDTSTPAGKLTVWTPATIKGYVAAKLMVDVFTVTRDYRPTASGPTVLMVIVAEQQRTAAGAQGLLDVMVKRPCPYDAQTITIKGRKAYFGTDNRKLATIAFTEGPVMVAIQMAARKDGSPESLKSALIDVAKQLP